MLFIAIVSSTVLTGCCSVTLMGELLNFVTESISLDGVMLNGCSSIESSKSPW